MKNKDFFLIFKGSVLFSFFLFLNLLINANYQFLKVDYLFLLKTYPLGLFAVIFVFYLNKLNSYRMDTHRERIFQENQKRNKKK